jgi:hypothetical protein
VGRGVPLPEIRKVACAVKLVARAALEGRHLIERRIRSGGAPAASGATG